MRTSRIIANSVNPIICRSVDVHFYVASDKQRLISDAPGLRGNKGSLGLMTFRMKRMKETRVFGLGCEVADVKAIYIYFYKHVNV